MSFKWRNFGAVYRTAPTLTKNCAKTGRRATSAKISAKFLGVARFQATFYHQRLIFGPSIPQFTPINSVIYAAMVEVKAAATVKPSDLRGLRKLAGLAGDQFKMGILLYDGDETMPLGDGIWAAPLSTLWGQ